MRKILLILGIALAVIVAAVAVLLGILSKRPLVPEDYTDTVATGGDIEARFLAMGSHEVSYFEAAAMSSFKKYEIFYPTDMAEMGAPLPVVVFVNGTGVVGSKYSALQKHMASWGFLTIATEEEYAWNGFSAEMCVRYLDLLNAYEGEVDGKANPFLGRIDIESIGITGHSQGGIGVYNAITDQHHAGSYKAAVALSSTQTPMAAALQWECDVSKIAAPILMMASTGATDQTIAPLEYLEQSYDTIPDSVPKVLARRNTGDHGEMLYSGDGYVTAWFMYWLQGDEDAGKAFFGENAELLFNAYWQDVKVSGKR